MSRSVSGHLLADEIVSSMKGAGYDVREYGPSTPEQFIGPLPLVAIPIVGRMQAIWAGMRDRVIEVFPAAPGLPRDPHGYMRFVEDIYRNDAVYLRTSRYVPPRWEAVRQAMPALFELLGGEEYPGVRAVLGHWMFGYIHPYPDGNGRMARFLMNAMLASGGFPWTVIRVDGRAAYLSALDSASIDLDIAPFAEFIAERVRWSMEQADA